MYKYWKLPFYMTFATLIMASNSAYSGWLNELKKIAPQITKEIEKVIEKPSDRSRDRSRREYDESYSDEYRYDYNSKDGIKLISTLQGGLLGPVRHFVFDGGNKSITHLSRPSRYFFLAYVKLYPEILEDGRNVRDVEQYFQLFYSKEYNAYSRANPFQQKRIISEWPDRIKAESASAPTTFQFFLQYSVSGRSYNFEQHFFPVDIRIGYEMYIPCRFITTGRSSRSPGSRTIPITTDKQFTLRKLSFSENVRAEEFLEKYSNPRGNIDIFISFTMTLKGQSKGGGLTARIDNFRGHTSKKELHASQKPKVGAVFREWSLENPGDAVVKSLTISHGREKDGVMSGGASFETAPEPDYRTLFKMYMASQGDILDTDALALEYHLLFSDDDCKQIGNVFKNEFSRADFLDSIRPPFTQALLDARDWPKTKVFRLKKGTVSFGEYDKKKHMFHINHISGLDQLAVGRDSGSSPPCSISYGSRMPNYTFALSGKEKIKYLPPMEEAQAKSFLNELTDKRGKVRRIFDIEVLVEIGPVPFADGYGRRVIPARITAARLLYREDGRVFHTYNTSLFGPTVAETASGTKVDNLALSVTAKEFTNVLTFWTLRDNPQLVDDDWALKLVTSQIVSEKKLWAQFDRSLTGRPAEYSNGNRKKPSLIYEWQTLEKEQQSLANGPVIDVFRQTKPDWSFVKQEKGWSQAVVGVFLFSRDKIKGATEFAARKLLPVYKRHLNAVLAMKPPERMQMTVSLNEPVYDFDTQSLQIMRVPGKYGNNRSNIKAGDIQDLFEPMRAQSSSGEIVLPGSARDSGLYLLPERGSVEPKTTYFGSFGNRLMSSHEQWQSALISLRNSPIHTAQVLALDRRLILTSIPMAEDEAQNLLTRIRSVRKKHGGYNKARLIFEPVRIGLGKWIPRYGDKKVSPILFGRVISVDLLMANGELIASFGPDDFPSAGEANAADFAKAKAGELQKQDAKAKRKAERRAEAERKQEPMKRAKEEVKNQIAKCVALPTAKERLQCLENLRESALIEILKDSGLLKDSRAKGTQEYREAKILKSVLTSTINKEITKARNSMRSEKLSTKIEDKRARRYYERNLKGKLWAPRKGTLEYEEAVANYLKAPKRETYGPDIVDLRLGMESRTANEIVQKRLQSRHNSRLRNETRPFDSGTLSLTGDASRGIALFFIKNQGRELVAAVSRRVYFGDKGVTPDQIIEGLRKKYGTETWSDGKKTMVWAYPTGTEHLSRKEYSGLVELIVPCVNWQGQWVKRLTEQERAQANQKRREDQMAYNDCRMEASIKAQKYTNKPSKYTKIYNKEMNICNEKYSYGGINSYQTKSNEDTRLPLMIGPEGSPETYAKYKKCGPVIITHLNTNKDGKVMDASFVLFDPAWIASQPAFFFKSTNEGTNKMIDF